MNVEPLLKSLAECWIHLRAGVVAEDLSPASGHDNPYMALLLRLGGTSPRAPHGRLSDDVLREELLVCCTPPQKSRLQELTGLPFQEIC